MATKNITLAYYEKTDEQKKRTLYYRKRKILNSDNKLLKEMLNIVERDVEKYKADFYIHDVELVKAYKGDPFLWVVRDYGTHFIYLLSDKFSKNNKWDSFLYFNSVLYNSGDNIKGIYFIENDEIRKISREKALFVLERYEDYVRKELKKY